MSKILIFESPEIIKETINIDEKKVIFNNLKNHIDIPKILSFNEAIDSNNEYILKLTSN
mgnify:CR=1 FL=1